MLKGIVQFLVAFIIVATYSCTNTKSKPVIKFSVDGNSIVIKNIDEADFLQVKNMYQANPDSINFISVLLTPGDSDSLQTEENLFGKIKFVGDSLIFSPEKPFLKGKTYLVESYIGIKFADMGKLFKGTVKHNLEPQQQILIR